MLYDNSMSINNIYYYRINNLYNNRLYQLINIIKNER